MNLEGTWFEWSLGVLQTRPLLLLVLAPLPLIIVAVIGRVYPHIPLVLLVSVPAILTFGLLVSDEIVWLVIAVDLSVVIVATLDLISLGRTDRVSVERDVGRVASINVKHDVVLTLINRSSTTVNLMLRDDVPLEYAPQPEQFAIRIGSQSRLRLEYSLKPTQRGKCVLRQVHVRLRSALGMWHRYYQIPLQTEIHIYPDMKQLSEYAVLARTNRLSLMGLRRTRKVGTDNEFERLRDYTPDDNYKRIDWRATTRRNKLTVKDFQANQSQRLIFLVDCGRMMTNRAGDLSLLDHALNSVLMLSYVALQQGDSVGLMSFSDTIHSYVPPRGGMKHTNALLHASFDRFPRLVESRYDEAFLHLSKCCRKRSLVILISNLLDEVNANQVVNHLTSLTGKHLPLGVLLRDQPLFDAVEGPYRDTPSLFRAAAAADIVNWRQQLLADLQHQGVLALDVAPNQLTAPLVNTYLDIKARHLL